MMTTVMKVRHHRMNNIFSRRLDVKHNVTFNVYDEATGKLVSHHEGHNASTNSLLTGIGHYLAGDGIFNQGTDLLSLYVPRYISVGTMGLYSQEEDAEGLPAGVGDAPGASEEETFIAYLQHCPGYGADGYDPTVNNGRTYMGLGLPFANRPSENTIQCELISDAYPRSEISYREVVPENNSELPKTIDIVFSGMISVGALSKFREPGKDYIFITEAGLWSKKNWTDGGDNGLLAGYRICPPSEENWDMEDPANRRILKENIIKVGKNQIVQIIWKIQLGGIEQLGNLNMLYPIYHEQEWIPFGGYLGRKKSGYIPEIPNHTELAASLFKSCLYVDDESSVLDCAQSVSMSANKLAYNLMQMGVQVEDGEKLEDLVEKVLELQPKQ